MGHASDIIIVDIYGDNDKITADCVDELDSFIESGRPDKPKVEYNIEDELNISIAENILQELVIF